MESGGQEKTFEAAKKKAGRFAPSPSGRMHLGNIFAAVLSWLSARKNGMSWILRIEDLDRQRCKKEYAALIMDDLKWLGLEWDGEVYFQSERDSFYRKAFDALEKKNLLYDCFCTRAERLSASAPQSEKPPEFFGRPGLLPLKNACRCRTLLQKEKELLLKERPPAKRLFINEPLPPWKDGHYGLQPGGSGSDFIIRRGDKNFSYQLAVVVDDALTGITEVVRGADLLDSTAGQIFLYGALGFDPPEFFHIPLLITKDGKRLSKRDRALSMEFFRAALEPKELLGKILYLAGLTEREVPLSLDEALLLFDWNRIPVKNIRT